jgi:hypothetical protein
MAEVKTLPVPPALYDFVLYWECASRDWSKPSLKMSISGNGSLVNGINWNSTYSIHPNDSGGKTLFGVTEATWQMYVKKYPNKGYSKDLNSMGKNGWFDQIEWFWNELSHSGKSANYACAFMMFQMKWVGCTASALKNILNTLKTNSDIEGYSFSKSQNIYAQIADATHAYKDPMIAFDYMKKANASYYYNISKPNSKNKVFRNGWLSRSLLSFLPYGLYVPTTFGYKNVGLKYESTLDEWEATAIRLAKENKPGYIKIMDWGATPESIEQITANGFDYISSMQPNSNNNSSVYGSGSYGGNGSVSQLGNYTTTQGTQNSTQQNVNRENVLNTLVNGSYTPNEITKCAELLTTDKKKGIKA